MKLNRLMELKIGQADDAARLYFKLVDMVEIQDAFKASKEQKDDGKVLNPMMEYIFSNLVKIENFYDEDGREITKDDLVSGKVPSYVYSLIRTGYFAQINSAENAEKKDFMSV